MAHAEMATIAKVMPMNSLGVRAEIMALQLAQEVVKFQGGLAKLQRMGYGQEGECLRLPAFCEQPQSRTIYHFHALASW
jgi:hypothetical protein